MPSAHHGECQFLGTNSFTQIIDEEKLEWLPLNMSRGSAAQSEIDQSLKFLVLQSNLPVEVLQ